MKINIPVNKKRSTILKVGGAVIAVFIAMLSYSAVTKDITPIQVDLDAWWGPVHLRDHNDTSIRPFKVVFSDGYIDLLDIADTVNLLPADTEWKPQYHFPNPKCEPKTSALQLSCAAVLYNCATEAVIYNFKVCGASLLFMGSRVAHYQMINDLRYRLQHHRKVVPPLEGVKFEYGFNSNQLQAWLKYWANEYPFKEREDFLNKYPQYKTRIQGLDVHFIRVKPQVPGLEVVPLLLLHGWPGSVREFYETIPHLTSLSKQRDDALEVIAPSLPGFGFSDAAVRPGLGAVEMAVVFRNLMQRLGHKSYYVQGGDWGAYIGQSMATMFPNEVLGFHTNLGLAITPKALVLTFISTIYPSVIVDPNLADRIYPLKEHLAWWLSETGYLHLQATKPDTLGIAMADSPGGLLAYVLQIFSSGTSSAYVNRPDGGLKDHYPWSHLIDNLMLYWVPNSITTSFRIYAETLNNRNIVSRLAETPTPVPTWTIHAKNEIMYHSPTLLKMKFPNLLNSTVLVDGGHFLALEMPEVFAADVLKAIAIFRQWHRSKQL